MGLDAAPVRHSHGRGLRATRSVGLRAPAPLLPRRSPAAVSGTLERRADRERDRRERLRESSRGPSCGPSRSARPRCETAGPGGRSRRPARRAPGCATRAGPRGPSTVNATAWPAVSSRRSCTSARAPPRDVDPRAVPKPNRARMPRDPLAVEVLAGDDDDAAVAPVERRRQGCGRARAPGSAAARRAMSSSKWSAPSIRPRQRPAQRADERIRRRGDRPRPSARSATGASQTSSLSSPASRCCCSAVRAAITPRLPRLRTALESLEFWSLEFGSTSPRTAARRRLPAAPSR